VHVLVKESNTDLMAVVNLLLGNIDNLLVFSSTKKLQSCGWLLVKFMHNKIKSKITL
jgi:hypothetical protein